MGLASCIPWQAAKVLRARSNQRRAPSTPGAPALAAASLPLLLHAVGCPLRPLLALMPALKGPLPPATQLLPLGASCRPAELLQLPARLLPVERGALGVCSPAPASTSPPRPSEPQVASSRADSRGLDAGAAAAAGSWLAAPSAPSLVLRRGMRSGARTGAAAAQGSGAGAMRAATASASPAAGAGRPFGCMTLPFIHASPDTAWGG